MEYTPTVTNLCPCCRTEEESSIHLYQCQHPQIRDLLLKGLDSIEDKLQQKETPSDVWMTIRAGIGEYCGFPSTIPEPSDERHDGIGMAFDAQDEIGWGNLLKGRLATHWGTLMQSHYSTHHRDLHHTGTSFMATLTKSLWSLYDTLWKARCSLLHDPDDINSFSNIRLNDRIRMYYDNPRLYLGIGDIHLLAANLDDRLIQSQGRKRQWLSVVDERARIQREAHDALLQQLQPINNFFTHL